MEESQHRLYWSQRKAEAEKALEYAETQLRIGGVALNDQIASDIGETRTPLIYEEVM